MGPRGVRVGAKGGGGNERDVVVSELLLLTRIATPVNFL